MKKELLTEIEINANPAKVWQVLTDFENYPKWNPFVKSLKGQVEVGKQIEVIIHPPGGNAMSFKPVVLAFTPNKELRWIGKVLIKGIFDGEHKFELIENSNGTTKLIHSEKFDGILVVFFAKMLDTVTLTGFKLLNEKIKELSEIA